VLFKLAYKGEVHRFRSFLRGADLLDGLKKQVDYVLKDRCLYLYWRDEDSNVVLDSVDDLFAAIEYAECTKK
ncbi:hypothetical protein PMAYCL1PPCAC_10840, partial [Pristionchus mayeri]